MSNEIPEYSSNIVKSDVKHHELEFIISEKKIKLPSDILFGNPKTDVHLLINQ